MDQELIRNRMLEELRADLAQEEIPPHAMTFKDIYKASGGASENAVRQWLQTRISDGRWKTERRAQLVYYWMVYDGDGDDG